MNPVRRRKLTTVILIMLVLLLVTGLILYALGQNISLFYSPTQIAKEEVPNNRLIRLGGMVVKGSIKRSKNDLSLQFKLTDFKHTLTVQYQGILPDLFREGQGIVALGHLVDKSHFKASEVLAKHDANYMPPEVKASLASGVTTREKAAV